MDYFNYCLEKRGDCFYFYFEPLRGFDYLKFIKENLSNPYLVALEGFPKYVHKDCYKKKGDILSENQTGSNGAIFNIFSTKDIEILEIPYEYLIIDSAVKPTANEIRFPRKDSAWFYELFNQYKIPENLFKEFNDKFNTSMLFFKYDGRFVESVFNNSEIPKLIIKEGINSLINLQKSEFKNVFTDNVLNQIIDKFAERIEIGVPFEIDETGVVKFTLFKESIDYKSLHKTEVIIKNDIVSFGEWEDAGEIDKFSKKPKSKSDSIGTPIKFFIFVVILVLFIFLIRYLF